MALRYCDTFAWSPLAKNAAKLLQLCHAQTPLQGDKFVKYSAGRQADTTSRTPYSCAAAAQLLWCKAKLKDSEVLGCHPVLLWSTLRGASRRQQRIGREVFSYLILFIHSVPNIVSPPPPPSQPELAVRPRNLTKRRSSISASWSLPPPSVLHSVRPSNWFSSLLS